MLTRVPTRSRWFGGEPIVVLRGRVERNFCHVHVVLVLPCPIPFETLPRPAGFPEILTCLCPAQSVHLDRTQRERGHSCPQQLPNTRTLDFSWHSTRQDVAADRNVRAPVLSWPFSNVPGGALYCRVHQRFGGNCNYTFFAAAVGWLSSIGSGFRASDAI